MAPDLRKSSFLVVTKKSDGHMVLRGPYETARGAKTGGFAERRNCEWQAIVERGGAAIQSLYLKHGSCTPANDIPTWRKP